MGIKELSSGWSFTEIGGGEGTKDGEWLSIEQIPTTVHVELLKAERIPDPVSFFFLPADSLIKPRSIQVRRVTRVGCAVSVLT